MSGSVTHGLDRDPRDLVPVRYGALAVALLAVVASISGLTNGFAFDDIAVIANNPALHTLQGAWKLFVSSYWRPEFGSFLYRPLTSLLFAVQWTIGGGSPMMFHAVSIALYAACAVVLYNLAVKITSQRAAILSAVVFAVHPVHVEAVANISGQGELWVALIVLLVINYYVGLRRDRPVGWRDIGIISAAYLVACGFKEHAIVLPALLGVAEITVVADNQNVRQRIRAFLPLLFSMAVAGMIFVAVRHAILSGVSDDSTSPLLRGEGFGTRLFTMLSVVMEWVRLFLWPATLSADYSFSRLRVYQTFDAVMIPGLLVLFGATWLGVALRKPHRGLTFGLSWAGIALLIPSNLVVVTGFVLAERTLFLASAGVAICIGVGADELLKAVQGSRAFTRYLVAAALALAVVAGIGRSLTRSPVWHDNERLFRQTIEDAPSSGHAHWMLAAQLFDDKHKRAEAMEEMQLAAVLGGKNDFFMVGYAGDMFATARQCNAALTYYSRALELRPYDVRVRVNAARCLLEIGKPADAKAVALAGVRANSSDKRLQNLVSIADSVERSGLKSR